MSATAQNREASMSKRAVNLQIGPMEPQDDPLLFELFCVRFNEETGEFMDAHVSCLCFLKDAVEAWLNGASQDEVEAIITGLHPDDDSESHHPNP